MHKQSIIKRSYGMACCRWNNKLHKIEVLMVKKKTTFSFVEFVLGHYKRNSDSTLIYLLSKMTPEEKLDIWSLDFSKMWTRIWLTDPESPVSNVSKNSKTAPFSHQDKMEKYLRCKNYFIINHIKDGGTKIRELLSRSDSCDTLWELPKGRSNPQEKPLNCAIRELQEETGIDPTQYQLLNVDTCSNTVVSGKIQYINNYYLSILHHDSKYQNSKELRINYEDTQQISEIIGIQWMDLDCIKILDPNDICYTLIKIMFRELRKKYKISTLAKLKIY